ncbi:sensor histidine kinase [Parablautia muri]|uniref:histidine kinase n=1 Tax=Parablautia muri TaxID=2320879 RepID=A0A9X5GUN4_9FIRM|nr:HAMP domain-containing sensor histidine kinase [Parablautia muri]NBJ94272.1 sensor histidine kinase [Parablautia muri]
MEHQKKQGESQENMQENYMGENDIEKSIEEQEQNVKAQNMENTQNKDNKKETKNKKEGRRKKKRRLVFFHGLQHILLVAAVVQIVTVFISSYVIVETKNGPKPFRLLEQQQPRYFEDSQVFNTLLGNSASDLICYGAIRSQMETDARFDAKKEVDVTAFAGRYNGIQQEYITAHYYLEDLIKWAQAGFNYENVYMNGEEVDQFLSRSRTVTKVNLEGYHGTVSYLNADLSTNTSIEDVSGNLLEAGMVERDGTDASVLHNRYRTVDGKNIENYVSSWDEYYELCSNVKKAAEDLNINYEEYLKYKELYDSGNTNVLYIIKRTVGDNTQIFTNVKAKTTNASDLEKELRGQCNKYIYYNPQNMQYETDTLIEESTLRYILNGYDYAYPEDTQIMIGVRSEYAAQDCFYQARDGFHNYVPHVWRYVAGAMACILFYLVLFVILTMREGRVRKKETGEIVIGLYPEDYIPTEIMILAAGAAAIALCYGAVSIIRVIWGNIDNSSMIMIAGAAALFVSLFFSFFYYSFVRRMKAGTFWRDSLVRNIIMLIQKWVLYFCDHSTLILRVWVPVGLLATVNLGGAMFAGYAWAERRMATLWVVSLILIAIDGAAGFIMYRSALGKQRILEGIKLIREGNLAHQVKEEGLYGEDLVLARAVNSIGDSVRVAVETSMKDERLKADLITNVSHDIKTPLTSIINYVDLIKRENIQETKIKEYVEVLDTKSQRLKQLTDDLVEASKISSGNIVLQWEKINLVELLNQTIGEFSEKFEEKSLYLIFKAPKSSVYIEADSRRIWRVIENLFNNIFKYALSGTRVYVDMKLLQSDNGGKQVIVSLKNISAQPLKVNPEELAERFIRGDESRTTEGSGLGLSIAKNLTEAQNGKFEIVMDGDLFKINLTFPLIEK